MQPTNLFTLPSMLLAQKWAILKAACYYSSSVNSLSPSSQLSILHIAQTKAKKYTEH